MRLFSPYTGPALLEQICSVENLTHAWRRVESNIRVSLRGKSAGPDAVTLHDFAADWPNQMARLADDLRTGTYQAQPPRRVTIPKRSGGERAIAILTVRDRIAQRAVQQVLEPLFDPFFLDCSFGCRPRVGVPHALTQVERYAAQGRTWVVDADVSRYFDSLDQRILLGLVRQRIPEVAILRLIAGWLETGTLHETETATLSDQPRSLLQRGGQALRNLATAAQTGPPIPPPPPMPAATDPYAAAAWEQPYRDHGSLEPLMPSFDPHLRHPTSQDALGNRVMTAVMLVKPVVAGARVAWPHLRRIGGQRLALAGAVAAGTVAAGELAYRQWSGRRGTPQGGALSPLLANIYLHPFDVALTSQGLRLVRFMDDFVIMCTGPTEAEQALSLARQQLATLRLTLHMEKTRIVDYAEGLDFLGQALLPRRTESRRFQGITSFTDAEQKLRETARAARKKFQRENVKTRERKEEQES